LGLFFPEKWFWINCNAFPENPDLTLTAVGSTRKVLNWTESVGIIGIHWQNRFYKFDILEFSTNLDSATLGILGNEGN
jgi:tocopherol cyclase